jgi:hypothetical protein
VSALSDVGADRLDAPKDERSKAKKRFKTTKLPMTTVARKKGTHGAPETLMQSHIDSIHSPHNTRNTIIKECIKSLKFQRGISSPPKLKLNNKRINLEIFNIYISIQSKKEKFFS